MWEEGINTKPQIYYNNNNAGTPQASKRKKKAIMQKIRKMYTGVHSVLDRYLAVFFCVGESFYNKRWLKVRYIIIIYKYDFDNTSMYDQGAIVNIVMTNVYK